ncbi:uncharacterized protein MELLADRAFT_91867 [Melampsora larici-populina 98AG31]|uniref:Uncharacterized protein n=1 Tax=Melampsora larici-populina (strain 98AG31 / pathotype 3-4-7) TaxID=747676 RepID=F4S0M9_MELLP|nr:uncharacterized protein MELLADRAFT_91867 [Melampsora larici-populina 98AG31]EGG01793.1 hypothetical protein MELLADRAFT_91867 [Melampsora larici-populina 98AG31]
MSAPKDIEDFNSQVKRTSDRINGNSASVSSANAAASTQGETTSVGLSNINMTSQTQAAIAKGKGLKGKKGGSQSTLSKDQPAGSSPAPPTISEPAGSSPAPPTISEPAGANLDDGQPLSGKETSNPANPGGESGNKAASSANSSGGSTIPATAAVSRPLVNPAQGVPAPLIAAEVINKTVVNGTSLPSVSSAAAHPKFMAGTSTILNRIDECLPDAIKTWLQSCGFDLVVLTPGGTSKETAEPTPNTQNAPASRGQNASSEAAEESLSPDVADTSLAGHNLAAATLSESASVTPGSAAIPAKRPSTTQLGPFDLTVDDDEEVVKDKPNSNKTIKFSEEGIESHGLVSLSKFFATKMATLDAYIPLSVFNTQWLRQDLLQQSTLRKRSVKEKLEDTYIGLTVPIEWKMTFGEWVVVFDLFIAYLEYYKWKELAVKFRSHKENVYAIKRENSNWPVAFRYDLAVRTAVMTFRLPDGSVANPAIRDGRLEREAVRETKRLKDFLPAFKEINPYADGEAKAFVDPITGVDSRSSGLGGNQSFNRPTPRSHSFSNHHSYNNLPVYDGPGGSAPNNFDDRRQAFRSGHARGRRGSWNGGNHGARAGSPSRRRENWRRDRDDRRGDARDNAGPAGRQM